MIISTIITIIIYIIICLYIGLYIAKDIKNETIKILFWIIYVIICCSLSNMGIAFGLWGELYYKKGRIGPRGPSGDIGDRGNAGNCADKCQTAECSRALETAINEELGKLSKSNLKNKNLFLKTKIAQICKSKEYNLVVEMKGANDFINYLKSIFIEWTRLLWTYGGPQFFQNETANANYPWRDNFNPITEMEKYDVYHIGMIREFKPATVEICNDPTKSNYMPERDKSPLSFITSNYYKHLYNIGNSGNVISFWRSIEFAPNFHIIEKEKYYPVGDVITITPFENIEKIINHVDKSTGTHKFSLPRLTYDYNKYIEFYDKNFYGGQLIDKVHIFNNYFDKTNLRKTYSVKIPRSIESRDKDKVVKVPIKLYMVLYGDTKNLGIRTPKILSDKPLDEPVKLIHNRSTFKYTPPLLKDIDDLYIVISTSNTKNREIIKQAAKLLKDNKIQLPSLIYRGRYNRASGGFGANKPDKKYLSLKHNEFIPTLTDLIEKYNRIVRGGVVSLESFNFKRIAKTGDSGKRDGKFGGRVRRFRGWIENPLPDGGGDIDSLLITGDCKAPTDFKLIYSNEAEYKKIADFADGIAANEQRDAILNAMQYSIWEAIAPKGYISLGHVFANSYDKPKSGVDCFVRCLPSSCVVRTEDEDIQIYNIGDIRVKISKKTGLFKYLTDASDKNVYEFNAQCAEYKYKETSKRVNKAFSTLGIGWNGSPNRGKSKYSIFDYLRFMPEGIITNSHTGRKYYIISSYSLDVSESEGEPFDFKKFKTVNSYLILKYSNNTQAYTDALSVAGNINIVIAPASNADIRQLWEIIMVDEATGTFRLRSKDTLNYLWHDNTPNLRGRAIEKQASKPDYKHTLFMNMKAAFGGDYPNIDKPATEYEGRFIKENPYIPV